jgi:steroid Delta-isomerase
MNTDTLPHSVRSYFEALRTGNSELFASAFAADAVVHDPVGTDPVVGTEQLKKVPAHVSSLFSSFDGIVPDEAYLSGNAASVRWTGQGTTPQGARVRWSGISTYFLNDAGLIQTAYVVFDLAEVMVAIRA